MCVESFRVDVNRPSSHERQRLLPLWLPQFLVQRNRGEQYWRENSRHVSLYLACARRHGVRALGKGAKGCSYELRLAPCKVFYVLTAIVVALAASLLWGGGQAYADSKPVARITNSGTVEVKSYDNLQDAFNEVQQNQTILLTRDIVTDKEFTINRGMDKYFYLELNGHTITSSGNDYKSGPVLHIVNSDVVIKDNYGSCKSGGLIGKDFSSCIRLDSGKLSISLNEDNRTIFSGYRVADVNGGELHQGSGTRHGWYRRGWHYGVLHRWRGLYRGGSC